MKNREALEELEKNKEVILNLGFPPEAWPNALVYAELIFTENEKLNLISRQMSPREWVENHFVDSLLPLVEFKKILSKKNIQRVVDLGSGGGMPGVILAISNPELSFLFFEKSPKKQMFLNLCVQKLALKKAKVEGLIQDQLLSPQKDLVIARAFKPLDVIVKMTNHFYLKKGCYFLYKGQQQKIQEEMALLPTQEHIRVISLQSPLVQVERHLVLIHS